MEFRIVAIDKVGFLRKKYEIYDDKGLLFTARIRSFLRSLQIKDYSGNELLYIKRPFIPFKIKFLILERGEKVGDVQKIKGGFYPHYSIIFGQHEYIITTEKRKRVYNVFHTQEEIAKISRYPYHRKKRIGIAMKESSDVLEIVSLALIIEWIFVIKKARRSA